MNPRPFRSSQHSEFVSYAFFVTLIATTFLF
jgi:hypothetical protein